LEEQKDCIELLNRVKLLVQDKYNPSGFNVGININEAAGQTVLHVHIHLIPRYEGDVEEPRGGVRGVIPKKRKY
jgi:diadenosine tetraphosphate (Ap4A) HIT family hydrolase